MDIAYASTRDLKDFGGQHKWYAYSKLLVWTGIVYGGYLGALGTLVRVLGSGAAPALVPAGILIARYFVRRHQLDKLGESYADQYPLSTLTEDTSFEQALSIAYRQNRRIDKSCIARLSMDEMRKAFNGRADKCQWLGYEEFVSVCLEDVVVGDIQSFRDKAGIILFVKPTESDRCCQWFVEYVDIMQLYVSLEGGKLVDLVRLMWVSPVLDRATRLGCTLGALDHLTDGQKKALCLALMQLHAPDIWISSELARYLDSYESVTASDLDHTGELHLGLWRMPGNVHECRLCTYRPANISSLWKHLPRWVEKYYLMVWGHCEACRVNALDRYPVSARNVCVLDAPTTQSNVGENESIALQTIVAPGDNGTSTSLAQIK